MINRRRLVTGTMAGVAEVIATELTGWPANRSRSASAQSAFDVSTGTPGCSQIALMFNIGAGYDPAVGILDTLAAYGASASMFVMGWLAEQSPWLVQQIAASGYLMGSHGYAPPELTLRSDDDVAWDLQTASATLTWAIGYDPGPWFTPYASASDERVRSIASSLGLITVGWSVSSGDWEPGATADSIYANAVSGAYDGAIIELHLDAQRSVDGTAVALPWIIDDLTARGYSLVTIPQIAGWC
jgi:peptidoglycan/xylan/chitin deacetylase (PgdA/CDA1 family)